MNATERRQAKAGRWVRTGAKGEKPGQLKIRGYGLSQNPIVVIHFHHQKRLRKLKQHL